MNNDSVTLKRKNGSHYCGGSILSNNKVLSAAHCKQSSDGNTAGAGGVKLNEQRDYKNVSIQTAHERYNTRTFEYDFMMITIDGFFDIIDDGLIKPVPIVNRWSSPNSRMEYCPTDPAVKCICKAAGYGYKDLDANDNPTGLAATLQYVEMEAITVDDCGLHWTGMIKDSMQCAFTPLGSPAVSSCMGDSGGPLVIPDVNVDVGYRLVGEFNSIDCVITVLRCEFMGRRKVFD